MSFEENKALVRKYYEMLDKGDVEGIMGIFADDISWNFPGMPEPLNKEGLGGLIQGFSAAFPDMSHTIRLQLAEDDHVATALTFKGTQTGELMGVPPSGNHVEFTGLNIHLIKGGKIVKGSALFLHLDKVSNESLEFGQLTLHITLIEQKRLPYSEAFFYVRML